MKITKEILEKINARLQNKLEAVIQDRIKTATRAREWHPNTQNGEWHDPSRLMEHSEKLQELAHICQKESILTRMLSSLEVYEDGSHIARILQSLNACIENTHRNPSETLIRECRDLMSDIYFILEA